MGDMCWTYPFPTLFESAAMCTITRPRDCVNTGRQTEDNDNDDDADDPRLDISCSHLGKSSSAYSCCRATLTHGQ